ncbi:unnamed protein product [Protopolystoma xenopodis]|uniref:Uncharacterized protein n=1 Tax=Protopolystoma xenopodis TaxID=117903 RepID=A0A448WBL4_9PLAT|nr:unnamed protein product [Protopolystoma xenopodis]
MYVVGARRVAVGEVGTSGRPFIALTIWDERRRLNVSQSGGGRQERRICPVDVLVKREHDVFTSSSRPAPGGGRGGKIGLDVEGNAA